MKKFLFSIITVSLSGVLSAQTGAPYIHDPSTIAECEGKYYTFGTGGGGLISEDGYVWKGGAERPGGGAAPDVIKIKDRYLVLYSSTGGGLGGGHYGKIMTMWNKTLDPKSLDFKFTTAQEVAASDGFEDCDAIDPGVLLDPTTGRLWVSYGTYFGNIRLIELDPETGKRKAGNQALDIAIDCEATDLIYRDGYYYLLGTHGTCCDGVNSTYNIVVGRSKSVTGPYLDNMGRDMKQGGGKMVVAAENRAVGAGHFGRFIVDEGVELMSFHWEADFDMSGHSVLAIKPLIWVNNWPKVGTPIKSGIYEIESERRGYALELAVDFQRLEQERQFFWRINPDEPIKSLETQKLSDVEKNWSKGTIAVRTGDYMNRPHQRWKIEPLSSQSGYLGSPYFKITIEGTDRALTASEGFSITAEEKFSGSDYQLWRIEQLTDGTYRIMPKKVPGVDGINKKYVIYSISDSNPILGEYDFKSDNSKWNFKQ